MDAIRLQALTRRFGALTAVDRLELSVTAGEIFGLVGPDGAGKTTTMRLLTGILEPTSGDAWVFDRHIVQDDEALKEITGYMSQRFGLYADLTVIENIRFYADIYGVPRRKRAAKIDELLELSNLAPFKDRQAGKLSGGMKQKLGLACALIHTPRVLFLDEPTNGVDPVYRRDFWRILYRLRQEGVTIFVSTAYLDEAERCSRVALLHEGTLIACDTPSNVKRLIIGGVVELRLSAPRRAAELLRTMPEVLSAGLFGDRLHLVTHHPQMVLERVPALLADHAVELYQARQIEPSLEDVFISVLSNEARKGGQDDTTH